MDALRHFHPLVPPRHPQHLRFEQASLILLARAKHLLARGERITASAVSVGPIVRAGSGDFHARGGQS